MRRSHGPAGTTMLSTHVVDQREAGAAPKAVASNPWAAVRDAGHRLTLSRVYCCKPLQA